MRRIRLWALVAFFAWAPVVEAVEPINSTRFGGHAIKGYDAVAYFDGEGAVKGSKEWSIDWNGATWLFTNAERRDRFANDPERFAPQYGGYCAWAVSQGYTASIDPEAWTVHDDKLYLNYSLSIGERWANEMEEAIARADRNWPELLAD